MVHMSSHGVHMEFTWFTWSSHGSLVAATLGWEVSEALAGRSSCDLQNSVNISIISNKQQFVHVETKMSQSCADMCIRVADMRILVADMCVLFAGAAPNRTKTTSCVMSRVSIQIVRFSVSIEGDKLGTISTA